MNKLLFTLMLFAALCNAADSPVARCAVGGEDVACTAQGAVRGVVENHILTFKGLPYAKPPVGNLRWSPPIEPAAWEGVRDGSRFSDVCPQIVANKVVGAEDCLTLNIWRQREPSTQPLPVIVFLTGGGNHGLSGVGTAGFGGVNYNGGALVPEGVVFVSFNIRLGVLGFLALPALDAERPERISGNYGNLDQIAMLKWLQKNVTAFGGDPKRITVFGTSAGGGNICALISAPLARGLFHAAAMQSSVPTGCEIPTLAEVQSRTGQRVVKAAGCDMASNFAACLRGKSVNEIVSALPAVTDVLPRTYGPNMDGVVFPDQPIKVIARGAHSAMPVIIGTTADETIGWVVRGAPITDAASYAAQIEKTFGAAARDRILGEYPMTNYPTPQRAFIQLTTDAQFTCTSRRVARVFSSAQKEPVYRYYFAHAMENDPQLKTMAANHTIEHAFQFPFGGKYRPLEADIAVQKFMIGYWSRFAKTGNPGNAANVPWPVAAGDAYLEISALPSAKRGPDSAKCDFWDAQPVQWPHL